MKQILFSGIITFFSNMGMLFRLKKRQPKVVVSVTSYPPRIQNLQPVLEAIFSQTRTPDKIVLWLADTEFVNKEKDLPAYLINLAEQKKIVIEWCNDLKPHKKYFYALQKYRNDIVITIDDDLLLEADMIECLLASYAKFPYAISAMRTHIMRREGDKFAEYAQFMREQNDIIGIPSMRLLATNGAGSLFPPRLLKLRYFDENLIKDLCLYTDDLWLKTIQVLSGIPVVQPRKFDRLRYVENSQNITLRQRNKLPEGNDNSLENLRCWADNRWGEGFLVSKIFNAEIYDYKHFYHRYSGKNKVLYFVPHQDDELLTMGIDICAAAANGKEVHVILCTDGSKSSIRKVLNNQKSCMLHQEKHTYNLSSGDFIAARDREFAESCLALGVLKENIHILPQRAVDGNLEVDFAQEVICYYLGNLGAQATVCTIYYDTGEMQHRDHKALGVAARNLLQKGIIRRARFFREPYCEDTGQVIFFSKTANSECAKRINKAIQAYAKWQPDQGRYAIGYHSVQQNFEELSDNMEIFYCKMQK